MTEDDREEGEGLEPGAPRIERGAPNEGDEDALAAATETLEVTSSTLDEGDLDEAETVSSAEVGGADPLVDRDDDQGIAVQGDDDRTTEHGDEGPPEVPTDTSGEPRRVARHLGLEELQRRQKRRSGARQLVIATSTLLILGGGGFAMAYWGVVEIPGITPPERSGFAVPPPVVLPGPQPETPVMSHVLFVDSWREAETPRAWADALRERMPDLLGLVTALSIDGDRQYALVVGPAYGAVEANDLKGPLMIAFDALNPDPDSWAIREAPYSFFFGEYERLGRANARVQELTTLSVPAFVLQVTYPGGGSALRVYGGAFTDEFQAGEMGRLLSENDLGDIPLTERRGRLPD